MDYNLGLWNYVDNSVTIITRNTGILLESHHSRFRSSIINMMLLLAQPVTYAFTSRFNPFDRKSINNKIIIGSRWNTFVSTICSRDARRYSEGAWLSWCFYLRTWVYWENYIQSHIQRGRVDWFVYSRVRAYILIVYHLETFTVSA